MSGIFGSNKAKSLNNDSLKTLIDQAEQRGSDLSGIATVNLDKYAVYRAKFDLKKLMKKTALKEGSFFMAHSTLIPNTKEKNQPIVNDAGIFLVDGLAVGSDESTINPMGESAKKSTTEIVAGLFEFALSKKMSLEDSAVYVLKHFQGAISCAVASPKHGKLVLFSNNGNLFVTENNDGFVFASDKYSLTAIGSKNIRQVREPEIFEIPSSAHEVDQHDHKQSLNYFEPSFKYSSSEEEKLEYLIPSFKRCTRCILPETMPYIKFDDSGVCNYCNNYKLRNQPRPKEELFALVEPYRRQKGEEVLVPFSGGRDSCYALHLIVNELDLKPITYTYDWGMVTDLGRRNISRMTSQLGIENITVAPDILKKRDFVRRNLKAWLKNPHLGMLSVLTAGDKHFFRHIESVKEQTGLNLNLWGINPLEVTHFKAGFLGVPPDFEEERVYSHGVMKQLRYQKLRFGAMVKSPGYFNRSLWDTLSGEYYRSFTTKNDYFHVFDYWRWDENQIDRTLLDDYDWEKATDTPTTWRIGDATAAFYNYVYYTVAGFTEHDTFRSNQIREGDISREEALTLVSEENKPRYQNFKWYLDVLGFDFEETVKTINSIPKLYKY